MSTLKNLFVGEIVAIVPGVDIDAPIVSANVRSCKYYSNHFAIAAKVAHEDGNEQLSAIHSFLNCLVLFNPTFEFPDSPYGPWMQRKGKRSPIPSDLTSSDIEALERLAPLANDPALRARLFDLLWILKKDHRTCAEAADSYIVAAAQVDTPETWPQALPCFQRALQLAGKLGRDTPLYEKVSSTIQDAVRRTAGGVEAFRACKYLRLIQQHRCGDPAEFALIAETIAQAADIANDPYRARAYWEVGAALRHNAKDSEGENRNRRAAAETYIVEAESRMTGQMASAMAAAGFLSNGIEALRRAGAPKERIQMLRKRLAETQQASLTEIETYSTELDISPVVEKSREHVRHEDLATALSRFVLGYKLISCAQLRETVLKNANDFPMQHLIDASIIDAKGRVIKHKPGLFGLSGDKLEERLLEEMFSHASQFVWSLRVSGYIEPGREQIYNDHHPNFDDLAFLVTNNPFIPPGHEGIYLRGIHAGFQGDFLVATHLLVPQIENSLRYVLESQGVDVSNLMSDRTQSVKVLGAIFGMKETTKIFGESLCFELRGCLIEKTGYDFRNRLAHGFVTDADCYSVAASHIWWLTLRICLLPIYQQLMAEQGTPFPEENSDQSA